MAKVTPAQIASALRAWAAGPPMNLSADLLDDLEPGFFLELAQTVLVSGRMAYDGAYNGATSYIIGDVVEHGGVAYVCVSSCTGSTPPSVNWWTIPGGGGGAPTDAQYLTLAANGTLTDERVMTPGTGLQATDDGPGGDYHLRFGFATEERGDVVYYGASGWARLPHGTAGQALLSGGHGADPSWGSVVVPGVVTGCGLTVSATSRLLGRYSAGSGAIEEVGLGDTSFSGGALQVDQARGLRETGGPTTLALGAVGDLDVLMRSGSNLVGVDALIDRVLFGTGEDGNLALDGVSDVVVDGATISPVGGVYTLTRDVHAQTITMSGVGTVIDVTGQWRIRCWKLVGDAGHVISGDGNDASGTSAGAALSAAGTLQSTGAQGGNGRSTAGNGNAGASTTISLGGAGGKGGDCVGYTGGAAGTATAPTPTIGRRNAGVGLVDGWGQSSSGPGSTAFKAGAGGGGGAAPGAVSSGAGGGGATSAHVYAGDCDFAGTISANGGAGSAAAGVNAGGGGGGGGGWARLVTLRLTRTPTVSASGGSGGAGNGTGSAGANGSAGTAETILIGS